MKVRTFPNCLEIFFAEVKNLKSAQRKALRRSVRRGKNAEAIFVPERELPICAEHASSGKFYGPDTVFTSVQNNYQKSVKKVIDKKATA